MWHNNFNNNMMSDRGHQESEANIEIMFRSLPERANWFEPAYVEPFKDDAIYQQPPTYFQQQQEYLQPYESSYDEVEYVGNYGYQDEYQYEPNPYYSYEEPHIENHQGNEDSDINSMLRQLLEGQKQHEEDVENMRMELKNEIDRNFIELNGRADEIASHLNMLSDRLAQGSYEDGIEDEECDFGSNVENMSLKGEVCDVFPTNFEVVVEPQEEITSTQQQSILEEEVEEIINLPEDGFVEDALALIVAAMNKETLLYNKASTINEKTKEEEEVVQLFELPPKVLHKDEVVEQRVPGSPTPRSKHPQGLREKLEWKIKHRRKMKPLNV